MNRGRILILLGTALLGAAFATAALAHHEPGVASADHDLAAVGRELSNPVSDVWALFTEFDFAWNDGDLNSGSDRVSYQTLFQPVMPIKLTENYKLITRPTLPIIWSNPVPGSDGRGGVDFDRKHGLGDMILPLILSPNAPLEFAGGNVVGGFGPTFGFPTATDTAFKSDQFLAGPGAIAVWKNEKVTLGVFPQYFWSYADTKSGAKNVSKGELLYFFYYNLPNAWQIGFNPTVSYNHKASGGNKWNVPIGVTLAKTTQIGRFPVKFQLGAEYSVAHEDDYGKRWLLKLNIIPVIPDLIKKPLFQ